MRDGLIFQFFGEIDIATDRTQRINIEINAPEVRLIGANGEQVGIVPIAQAMKMAEEAEVDLVEIAPLAKPPVCKLMDYGKFKYREAKKAHEAKLKQKQIHVKEVKFRPGTDEGDYQIKLRNLKGDMVPLSSLPNPWNNLMAKETWSAKLPFMGGMPRWSRPPK